ARVRGGRARVAWPVDAALELGHDALVGLVLAPHWSTLSVARYEQLFLESVAGRVETRVGRGWGTETVFVDLLARRCAELASDGTHVVFTAHSLPARILEQGDP